MKKSKLVVELKNFISVLDNLKANYCLIGGLAVSVRSLERTTKDIDFVILVKNNIETENFVKLVRSFGYEIFSLLENKKKQEISTVRLSSDNSNIVVDLLFNSCGIEKEIIDLATQTEIINSLFCKVASRSSLIAMKTLSSNNETRLQDVIDIQHLMKEATEAELKEAFELVKLIEKRGYSGEANLQAKFLDFKERFLNKDSF